MSDSISKDFVHLHVHTEFSLLDGLSRIKKLVGRAKELNMHSLAITDHGTMFGVIDFFDAAVANDIKPIIGVEAYMAPRGMEDKDPKLDRTPFHLLLLAKNETGYKNLLKISSTAQLRGYYYKPRIDFDFLSQHSEGLIATSGCLASKIPRLIQDGDDAGARDWIGRFTEVFGEDNFYLELQEHDIDIQRQVNQWLIDYRRTSHTNIGLVATTDLHYVNAEDFDIHDTQLCIQTGSFKEDTDRLAFSDNSYYLYSTQEMWNTFGQEVPEALHNSVKIAEMTDINLRTDDYHLPNFPVPEGYDAQSYLRYLVEKGMDWRFGERKNDPVLRQRMERELGIIHDMGFDTYFLIVWDLCEFARYADIWWNVRGSGAGSLAAYCLGITNIDPIQNSLLFERFLNPGRVSMPDIDLDYPDDRRGEMIAYSVQKYGDDKVAAIITFGTLGAKAAVRDVGRVMHVSLDEVNKAAALIPQEARQKDLKTYVEEIPDLKQIYDTKEEIRRVIDTAAELQGIARHASTHAAGVIIADKPLVEYVPLHRLTGKDPSGGSLKAVTQFPMETAESIGLLKVDFLGLSTLTILRKAADLIEYYHGIKYTMDNIPYRHGDHLTEEETQLLDKTFEMLGRGETIGVFQLESTGMQQMLRGMRPKTFQNVIAGISLYRPGPMDYIPRYNRRLHGEEEVEYRHEKLRPILEETYGILVYQEQIMQVAGELFGYDLGEADLMRRAVSKKKQDKLLQHKELFIERGPENGIDAETAEKIFDDIEFFANYGFNKSHASDYAVITVQTAYLKCHYPAEYMTALLSVHHDDSAKVATFLEECRRMEIPVLPPDINYSALNFDIQQTPDSDRRGIRFGLAAVKNAGDSALQFIIEEREANGRYTDLLDFCKRVNLGDVGRRTLESLIKVGAMRDFGERPQLLAVLERMVTFSTRYFKDKAVGQMSMFGDAAGSIEDDMLTNLPAVEHISNRQQLQWEKELTGLYVSGRPVDKYRDDLSQTRTENVQNLKQHPEVHANQQVSLAGEIVSYRKLYTKNNEAMVVIQLEDWHDTAASIDVVLFPRTWSKVEEQLENEDLRGFDEGEIVQVFGKFDTSRDEPQVICERVTQNFEILEKANGNGAELSEDHAPTWADEADNMVMPPADDDLFWSYAEPESVPLPPDDTMPAWAASTPEYVDYDEETGEISQPAPPPTPQPESAVSPASHGTTARHTPSIEPQIAPNTSEDSEVEEPPEHLRFDDEIVTPSRVLVYLQRTGDDNKDRRRLIRVHGLLVSYPGSDRFTILIESADGSTYQKLEFPNHTTNYCQELLDDLTSVVGAQDNVEYIPGE